MNRQRAIVIGSGIAGMATAIRLASSGFSVTVIEKNLEPGGKLTAFSLGEYQFDRGPSLFTQPNNIRDLFSAAGYNPDDFLKIRPVELANTYFFEDGTVVRGWSDPQRFDEEIHTVLGEPRGKVIRYLRDASVLYEKIGRIFINYPLNRASTWFHPRIATALTVTRRQYLFDTVDEVNRSYFKDPRTIQLFNRFATYNGSNPYVAPGMLTMIPHLEHNEGTFYPEGGMISITRALIRLAEKLGVEFRMGEQVRSIRNSKGRVQGVDTDKASIDAHIVVSNMDAYYTYQRLLSSENGARRVLRQERSSSALIFYWGIDGHHPDTHLHNILFASNYHEEFDDLFVHKKVHGDPTIYINNTSVMEPGMAPAGKSNWFVMVNAPAVSGHNWDKEVGTIRENIIRKTERMLGIPVSLRIEAEQVWTPAGIDSDTFSFQGSLYGTSSNSRGAAFFRHTNESRIRGLYFTGGSVHPGGGLPLCLAGAKITAALISEQFGQKVVA